MLNGVQEKLFYRIGEVSRITGLKPHVLRYWEEEFPAAIRPSKTESNRRVYQKRDIEAILLIRRLLYEEKFTIEGAREKMKELKMDPGTPGRNRPKGRSEEGENLEMIRQRLVRLKRILEEETA